MKLLLASFLFPISFVSAQFIDDPVVDGIPGGVPLSLTCRLRHGGPRISQLLDMDPMLLHQNITHLTHSPNLGLAMQKCPPLPHLFPPGPVKVRREGDVRFVENSGLCEKKGVYQASGYIDISPTNSMWFWYFEARNNPQTAPLALWINGGPGSSSMTGLLQENGPCRISLDGKSIAINPYSWNNNVNMIFIDQPIGSGFSHGQLTVQTTRQASEDLWTFFQYLFAHPTFSSLSWRKFGIWTESYGGHFGPDFASYILKKNEEIKRGCSSGKLINLQVLGIGNGLTDALNQFEGYLKYITTAPALQALGLDISSETNAFYLKPGGCQDLIQQCYELGTNTLCLEAQDFCTRNVTAPLMGMLMDAQGGGVDPYDVDKPLDWMERYTGVDTFLNGIKSIIGAEVDWVNVSIPVCDNFGATGDRVRNFAPALSEVIDAGIRTVIYDGDADMVVNYIGVEEFMERLTAKVIPLFNQQVFQNYSVSGHLAGAFKSFGSLSFVRIFGAGHMVPAYNYTDLADGEVALAMFEQAMNGTAYSRNWDHPPTPQKGWGRDWNASTTGGGFLASLGLGFGSGSSSSNSEIGVALGLVEWVSAWLKPVLLTSLLIVGGVMIFLR